MDLMTSMKKMNLVAGLAISIFSSFAFAAANTDIKVTLEEPVANSTYASIANIPGWAVANSGITLLELYIDGELITNISFGGLHTDVGTAFPNFPDSNNSGFSMVDNYKSLSAGEHTVTVRAIDKDNDYNEDSAIFTARKFSNKP